MPRDTRAEYLRRKARLARAGTTLAKQRTARAHAEGYRSTAQKTYWRKRLTDAYVRELAEEIGGPIEADRPNSLMSREANRIVNGTGREGDWRVRLLRAAGRI